MTAEHEDGWMNRVELVGRLSADPVERELPSGDRVWTLRLVIPRSKPRTKGAVDTLDCAAWTPRTQRSARSWRAGDVVRVTGEVRRRFFGGAAGAQSRFEVELDSGRLIRRAASA